MKAATPAEIIPVGKINTAALGTIDRCREVEIVSKQIFLDVSIRRALTVLCGESFL